MHVCLDTVRLSCCGAWTIVCNHTASKGVCCVCVCVHACACVNTRLRAYLIYMYVCVCVVVGGRRGRGDEHVCVPAYMHVLSMDVYCRCY